VLSLIHKSDVQWGDIGGLEDTKDSIKSAYALALAQKPAGVQVSSWRNLLMYGPPGTGKTLLAAATAGNLEATFFNVKVSSLLSKYFGESTKLISALFSVARRLSPAVIFLDEFESLTPVRGSGESGAERRIVSTLLAELDGLQAKDDTGFVLTICATNLPWLLDLAILSRFQRRIYVPLPDPDARRRSSISTDPTRPYQLAPDGRAG
jgi:katanin p60 ATPase-containing subunit A1